MTRDKVYRNGEDLSWSDLDCNRLHGNTVFPSNLLLVNYYWFAKHPDVIKWSIAQVGNPKVEDKVNYILLNAYGELARIKAVSKITHPQYARPPEASKHSDLIIFIQDCQEQADFLTRG